MTIRQCYILTRLGTLIAILTRHPIHERPDGAGIGPDGHLWFVDEGSPGINGSAKIFGVLLDNYRVGCIFYIQSITGMNSGHDDIRFSSAVAYLSKTVCVLLVMDTMTGDGVSVLINHALRLAYFPMSYDGLLVSGYSAERSTLCVGLNRMEVPQMANFEITTS